MSPPGKIVSLYGILIFVITTFLTTAETDEERQTRYRQCNRYVTTAGCPHYENDNDEIRCFNKYFLKCHWPKLYHCTRQYNNKTFYIDGCAESKNCFRGEAPYLRYEKDGRKTTDLHVVCDWCQNEDFFNEEEYRNSSKYTECDEKVKCDFYNGFECKIDSGNAFQVYKQNRKCRCNTTADWVLSPSSSLDSNYCTSDAISGNRVLCHKVDPCLVGYVRSINSSCVEKGDKTGTTDNLIDIIKSSKHDQTEKTTIQPSTKESNTGTSNQHTFSSKPPDTEKTSGNGTGKNIRIGILCFVGSVGIIICLYCNREKVSRIANNCFQGIRRRINGGRSRPDENGDDGNLDAHELQRFVGGRSRPDENGNDGNLDAHELQRFVGGEQESDDENVNLNDEVAAVIHGEQEGDDENVSLNDAVAAVIHVIPEHAGTGDPLIAQCTQDDHDINETRYSPNVGTTTSIPLDQTLSSDDESFGVNRSDEVVVEIHDTGWNLVTQPSQDDRGTSDRQESPTNGSSEVYGSSGPRHQPGGGRNFTKFHEENRSPHDGRVWEATDDELVKIKAICEDQNNFVDRGGFGEVFRSPKDFSDWKMVIAIKRLKEEQYRETCYSRSTINMLLAARLKHFAIVPLLMKEPSSQYFIFPYFEQGCLYKVLDKRGLNQAEGTRVLYHIASALHYMHTPKNRGATIHGDVTSKNIVLDWFGNAFLLDFGLARNLRKGQNQITQTNRQYCSPGYEYPPSVQPGTKTDWYQFGVVILEILTNDPPYKENLKALKDVFIEHEGAFDCKYEEEKRKIWLDNYDNMKKLAKQCFENITNSDVKDSSEFVCSLKDMVDKQSCQYYVKDGGSKCLLCKINPPVSTNDKDQLLQKCTCYWKEEFLICIACLRKSYLNTVICFCNKRLRPTIGRDTAALLINGIDNDYQDTLDTEVDELADIMSRKHPLVMGLRKEFVRKFRHGLDDSFAEWARRSIEMLKKEKIKTLFFYYTGHHSKGSGPQINFEHLRIINSVTTLEKLIMILDCCDSQSLDIKPLLSGEKEDIKLIRINSCSAGERTIMTKDGSIFTKYLKLALSGTPCETEDCDACTKYARNQNDGIIRFGSLVEHLSYHMKSHDFVVKSECKNVSEADKVMGYYIDFTTDVEFKLGVGKTGEQFSKLPKNFEELQTALFKSCLLHYGNIPRDRSEKIVDLKEVVSITYVEGPKERHATEIKSLEDVQIAWDLHLPLYFDLRDPIQISKGPVMVILRENENLEEYHEIIKSVGTRTADKSVCIDSKVVQKLERNIQNKASSCENLQQTILKIANSHLEVSDMDVEFSFPETEIPELQFYIVRFVPKHYRQELISEL